MGRVTLLPRLQVAIAFSEVNRSQSNRCQLSAQNLVGFSIVCGNVYFRAVAYNKYVDEVCAHASKGFTL
jgi:hypothetical protein